MEKPAAHDRRSLQPILRLRMPDKDRVSFGLPIVRPASSPDGDMYVPEGLATPEESTGAGAPGRPTIGVYFACANRYVRVTRNSSGEVYLARCPKCAKTMSFRVGAGGSSQRLFRLTCA